MTRTPKIKLPDAAHIHVETVDGREIHDVALGDGEGGENVAVFSMIFNKDNTASIKLTPKLRGIDEVKTSLRSTDADESVFSTGTVRTSDDKKSRYKNQAISISDDSLLLYYRNVRGVTNGDLSFEDAGVALDTLQALPVTPGADGTDSLKMMPPEIYNYFNGVLAQKQHDLDLKLAGEQTIAAAKAKSGDLGRLAAVLTPQSRLEAFQAGRSRPGDNPETPSPASRSRK